MRNFGVINNSNDKNRRRFEIIFTCRFKQKVGQSSNNYRAVRNNRMEK